MPDELWMEVHDIVQETRIKTIPMEKKCKKAKWLSGGGLTNSCEKKRYRNLNSDFQRIARRDKKAFFRNQCKEIEENNRMEKTRDLFKEISSRKWQPTPVFLPGESQGQGSLVGCRLWGHIELDMTEVT